jgi:hypothetical protein
VTGKQLFLNHEGLTTPTSLSLRLSRPPRKGEEISISEFVNLHNCEERELRGNPSSEGCHWKMDCFVACGSSQ